MIMNEFEFNLQVIQTFYGINKQSLAWVMVDFLRSFWYMPKYHVFYCSSIEKKSFITNINTARVRFLTYIMFQADNVSCNATNSSY